MGYAALPAYGNVVGPFGGERRQQRVSRPAMMDTSKTTATTATRMIHQLHKDQTLSADQKLKLFKMRFRAD